ncbi:protein kinase [Sorangium cellulosum]|uniref:Protein kinase n=1 Tax=Sorangium cellulosum TaxID=56 RepID=A0A2L0F626_SORCE|nr:serine/threonine-protein kinase [Sorangium cellulosum]AUX46951.1 protein kinase [Sorangium cellulosum]
MRAGEIVGERFEIEGLAGSGGMGHVYRARDRHTGDTVALKVLRTAGQSELSRFSREVQALASLRIPGVVRYIAHGVTADGKPYLVMEWASGDTLAQRIARRGLTPVESVEVAARVAETLGALHAQGVVHRDLKPGNLLLVEGRLDRVMVLDFGIARIRIDQQLTMPGTVLGTPEYMAPEQARGDPTVDARADVFALGCVLFRCLTGRPAFQGAGTLAVLVKVLLDEPPRLRELCPELPEELDALVASMLAKQPSERPRDGAAVAEALGAIDLRAIEETAGWAPAAAAARGLTLTSSELRVTCLVLAHERHGPEDATRVQEEEHERALARAEELRALAARYQSQIELIDARSPLLVLTSAEEATDLAAHAARCALSLQALLGGAPVSLVTGRAELTPRLPLGELIDRAVQLLPSRGEATPVPAVRIDEVTAGLLGGRFETSCEGGALFLHGARDDLRPASPPALLGKPMACIGRERELAVLSAELGRSIEESTSGALLVVAAAGMGKSRLRQEFIEKLWARGAGGARGAAAAGGAQEAGGVQAAGGAPAVRVEVWLGQGDPMSSGSAFGLLSRALRGAMGIVDGEPLEERRRKVRERVARHRELDVGRVSAFLGELLGAPFPDDDIQVGAARRNRQLMGDQLRLSWEDFIRAECAAHPVLLVLEDLQWGDLPTITMVEAALRSLKDLPFLVLGLGRPEVHEVFPGLAQGRFGNQLLLPPLTRRASERLVREALGSEAGAELVKTLVDRADGNPFFLEEQVRAVAAGHGADLPETVLAMVQARIEALDAEARRVLRAASVFGQAFWPSGVSALLGGAGVTRWLSELERREVIHRRGPGRLRGEVEYRFRHALVREAAYGMLTEADRRLGHALAGAWLEGAGEPDAMALAEHFERGGVPERAAAAYLRAAQHALEGNDLGAAIARAERGLECAPEPAVVGALRLVQAEAHVWRGDLALAEQRGTEAVEHLDPGSAPWFAAIAQVVAAAGKLGGFDRVEQWMGAAAATPAAEGADSLKSTSLSMGAAALAFAGRPAVVDALIAAVESVLLDGSAASAEVAASLHQARAFRAMSGGDPGACVLGLEAALAAYEQVGDRRNACITRANLGYSYGELGDFGGAEAALRSALDAADRMGLHEVAAATQASLGQVLAYRGRLAEARAVEEVALASSQRLGDPRAEVVSRSYLAKIALLGGDFGAAEREARLAETLESASPLRVAATAIRARALLGLGRAGEALAAAAEALAALESLGGLEEGESMIRLVYAEALSAAGDPGKAAAAIAAARDKLLDRAESVRDPEWRRRFLSLVPDNARTLALAEQWVGAERCCHHG